ncbi:hypothetical protein GOBAR_AA18201 [Gossypium barbadense]|uniref:Protein kinase domain-containing protein n=1 Tax=Gossypium barbadense TaxID=3634 RepID=A0A2P5XGJ8_GOSBA|nr:hypothetical protein GOBAR_AA18201 [Gossypium barbadense]
MTNNFNGEKLGEGGFGVVYKGYLKDLDTYVAVKQISKASKQGIKEYTSEVKIISRSRHKNLVKLIGQYHEKGELILIYELMANGSLDSHLFKGKTLLTWEVRFKIVQDLASALFYLHEEGDHCVLHRDIKASNIMLDSSFNAKLGDFGLARLVDHAKASQTTHLAGTMGYLAPECVSSGKASKESDVYSFGVVALEIACGRRSIEPKYEESQASLVAWVWNAYGSQRLPDVADPKLCMNFDAKQMECLLMVGLWCVHPDQHLRPSIRQTIQDLASALFYLHEEGDHCVLHRDIKASNIMLDSSFNAKLGDFGLARLVDHAKASQTTHLAGTMGYLAPECVSSGKASKESDVYSFGVVALEIACGRRSIEPKYEESQASLVAWVWNAYGSQRLPDVADPKLCMNFDAKQMECLLMVGLWCVHPDQHLRPSIRQTIQVINFEAPLPKLPGTRPTPTYDAQITSEIQASEPCVSSMSITVPC